MTPSFDPSAPHAPKLLDRLTAALQERNYTPALIRAFRDWIRWYIFFHNKEHPANLGSNEIAGFLAYLAGPGEATLFEQAEAGKALRFLYDAILDKPLAGLELPRGLPDAPASSESTPGNAPKLLEQMRHVLRVRHYARRTEDCYVDWAKRFIVFHGKRHPAALGTGEVSRFLTHLAVEGHVSVSTQLQGAVGSSSLQSAVGSSSLQRQGPGSSLQRQGAEWSDS